MNSRVAVWYTALPLERRRDVTLPGVPSSCAQKAAARRSQTVGGAAVCFWLLSTVLPSNGPTLVLRRSLSTEGLCMAI